MSRIIDISRPLQNDMPGWPGDTPFRFRLAWSKADGATVNVGELASSIHIGTHVDAPFHFEERGTTTDHLVLDPYVGPARVVDVRGRPVITVADLEDVDLTGTPRLLLRTDGWVDPTEFPGTIPVIAADVPGFLASRGVILLGLDVPSVDTIDSKDLANHHALGSRRIAILESVDLAHVVPGTYELIAVPLRIVGADGSPVRAILRTIGPDPA